MPVSPKDIVDKVFTKSFRGYDEEEVDLFLDEIIKEMEKQNHESANLRAKVDELTLKLGMLYASLQNQKGNLAQAQSKAQEYLNSTNIKARLMMEQAQRKARDIVANAEQSARQRMTEAEKQARNIISDAEAESVRLQTHLERESIGLATPSSFADARKKQQELDQLTQKIQNARAELERLENEAAQSEDGETLALPTLDFSEVDMSSLPDTMPPMPPGYTAATQQLQDKPELVADKAEGQAQERDAQGEALDDDAALDEEALLELLPPGWDNLEELSDAELNMLMKALGIPIENDG